MIDEAYQIIDGHAVVDALKELGSEDGAVIIVRNRTPAEIRALRLALNRIVVEAKWHQGNLGTEFCELLELGFDLELTGFDAIEIDMTLDIEQSTAGIVEGALAEDVEPMGEAAVVARGDVWRLGDHVLACGDSQDAEFLCRLMGERKAAVVFTDPPYNVKIRGHVSGLGKTVHREFVMGSGEMSEEEFKSFLVNFLVALLPSLVNGAILFVCMDWRHLREILNAGDQADLELKNVCGWVLTVLRRLAKRGTVAKSGISRNAQWAIAHVIKNA